MATPQGSDDGDRPKRDLGLANVFWGAGLYNPTVPPGRLRRLRIGVVVFTVAMAAVGGVIAGLVSGTGDAVLWVVVAVFAGVCALWALNGSR